MKSISCADANIGNKHPISNIETKSRIVSLLVKVKGNTSLLDLFHNPFVSRIDLARYPQKGYDDTSVLDFCFRVKEDLWNASKKC